MNSNPPTTGAPNNYDRLGESSRAFIAHVKQYFHNLPLVTFSLLVATSVIALVDSFGRFRNFYHNGLFTQWLYLSVSKVINKGQVHRLAVYPLASPGLSLVIANLLLSITYMAELEKRKGSLKTLWILICFLTVIPGIGYVFFVSVFAYMVKMADGELQHTLCAGLSGLAVGLSVWSTLEDQDEEEVQYRMLFGVIRIPRRLVPVLTIAFYFFLAPDTSLILHICAAGSGYLYASKQLPAFLLPSDETFQRQEQEGWFHRLTNRRGFVSVDDIGPYLPISTTNTEPIHSVPGVSTPFQGQGTRLGD